MKVLTKAEAQVMRILWALEKGLVKDVMHEFDSPKPAYNTVSTTIRTLEKKGFIGHKAYGRTHEYYPLVHKDKYIKFYLDNVLKDYFNGSFRNLEAFYKRK